MSRIFKNKFAQLQKPPLGHTFATRLLSKTSSHQDIKAVAELRGDDYKVVIKTYLHTDTGGKHDLVDQL